MKKRTPRPTQKGTSTRVLVLRATDEMRHPYENQLVELCAGIEWFSAYDQLLAYSSEEEPMVVVVDLDCLPSPLDTPLVELKTHFPSSDLIALSYNDSAHHALLAIRSGFVDYLIKPVSPEELAWAIEKCQQRSDLYRRLDPRADILRAISQVSTCATPSLVKLATIDSLRHVLSAQGVAWLGPFTKGKPPTVECSLPRTISLPTIESLFPVNPKELGDTPRIWKMKDSTLKKVAVPCQNPENGLLFLWGVPAHPGSSLLLDAQALVEHAEISLVNLKKLEQIKRETFVDDLTGLYNSRYLKFAISNAMAKCKQPNQSFSVLFIDVDHFKSVNDRYGHLIGSEFLVAIGKTIKNAVRNIDPVFRYGGDEFVVILQETGLEGAGEIGERIRKNIERRVFLIKNQRLQSTVSIGVATYPQHAIERETLLKLADEAMYAAKKESRNAVHLAYGLKERRAS